MGREEGLTEEQFSVERDVYRQEWTVGERERPSERSKDNCLEL